MDEVATAVAQAVDPMSMMQRICDRTLELIPHAEGVAIGLHAAAHITYVCQAGLGLSSVGTVVGVKGSLSGVALTSGTVQRTDDTATDDRVDGEACRRLGVRSLVCVPLTRVGDRYGVMAVNSSCTYAFNDDEVAMLTRLAEFVGVAVGSAHDMYRASAALLDLTAPRRRSEGDRADTDRYVMGVLDPETAEHVRSRALIRSLIDEPDQLSVVYQPIVDLGSGRVVGVEALARFDLSPHRSPDVWFDIARRVGLGVELETLAIRHALQRLDELPDYVSLAVNAGPDTVTSLQLSALVARRPSHRLILELTEHSVFDRHPSLHSVLDRLRSSGIRLSVDDAGSGYSSLTHILKIAPDIIKLDRELVAGVDHDPVRRALVTSMIAFAKETGASILAEGVETQAELDAMVQLGVPLAQGYRLGRPVPFDRLSF